MFALLASGDEVVLPGDGSATLQHVHADDVAQAFELALENPRGSVGEAFHVASRDPVTLAGYANAVASWSDRAARLTFLPFEEWRETVTDRDAALTLDHMMHSPHASIAKAESVLGFEPRHSCTSAVRDALTGN